MSEENKTGGKLAAVRVRGLVGINKDIKDTLDMLRLYRKNYCVVLDDNTSIKGMLNKVKDFVTWGNIDEGTLKSLKEKRAEKDKKFFRLNPPKKGFGRKGIKIAFVAGGALGERKEKINDLINRMI